MTRRDEDLLAGIGVGDRVWLERPGWDPGAVQVTHSTAKFVHVGTGRFRRSDGRSVGSSRPGRIHVLTDQPERLENARAYRAIVEDCRKRLRSLSERIKIPAAPYSRNTLLDADRVAEAERARDRVQAIERLLDRVRDLPAEQIDALVPGAEA